MCEVVGGKNTVMKREEKENNKPSCCVLSWHLYQLSQITFARAMFPTCWNLGHYFDVLLFFNSDFSHNTKPQFYQLLFFFFSTVLHSCILCSFKGRSISCNTGKVKMVHLELDTKTRIALAALSWAGVTAAQWQLLACKFQILSTKEPSQLHLLISFASQLSACWETWPSCFTRWYHSCLIYLQIKGRMIKT